MVVLVVVSLGPTAALCVHVTEMPSWSATGRIYWASPGGTVPALCTRDQTAGPRAPTYGLMRTGNRPCQLCIFQNVSFHSVLCAVGFVSVINHRTPFKQHTGILKLFEASRYIKINSARYFSKCYRKDMIIYPE